MIYYSRSNVINTIPYNGDVQGKKSMFLHTYFPSYFCYVTKFHTYVDLLF